MRVGIEPTFGDYAWLVDLHPLPQGCVTDLAAIQKDSNRQRPVRFCRLARVVAKRFSRHAAAPAEVTTVRFLIPGGEYIRLVNDLDWRLDRWRGTDGGWTDGTGVDVERRSNGRARSVSDNAPFQVGVENPAPAAAHDVQRLLLAYGPAGFAPRSETWTVTGELGSCGGETLATGKPVAFTSGNSRCGGL